MTHGLGVRGFVEKHGKLPVCIVPEFCAPVGEHARKFASQIGARVRTNLSTMNSYSWKNVDSGEKEAIIQNVAVLLMFIVIHELDLVVFIALLFTYAVFFSVLLMLLLSILNSRNNIFFIHTSLCWINLIYKKNLYL